MKKKSLKNLQLNKYSISNLKDIHLKGGRSNSVDCQTQDIDVCDTDLNSCYWLVCPFSNQADTICVSEA
ncbi:hypothetical protein [uncultured Kordia sp.]|uniref:hypothetical protein n=1 Tax=uncultured Kordia sp. TaxID=507699 RepID=UPI002610FF46|nr:hypothetical protein [uncultured Kordia sp.]